MNPQKQQTESHGAHSGIHQKSSEYNDGGNVTHYLGNDEYKSAEEDRADEENEDAGKVAYGNNVSEESEVQDEDRSPTETDNRVN